MSKSGAPSRASARALDRQRQVANVLPFSRCVTSIGVGASPVTTTPRYRPATTSRRARGPASARCRDHGVHVRGADRRPPARSFVFPASERRPRVEKRETKTSPWRARCRISRPAAASDAAASRNLNAAAVSGPSRVRCRRSIRRPITIGCTSHRAPCAKEMLSRGRRSGPVRAG